MPKLRKNLSESRFLEQGSGKLEPKSQMKRALVIANSHSPALKRGVWSLDIFLNEQRQDAAASFERPERATDISPGQRAEWELRTLPWVQIPAGFSLSPKDLRFLEVFGGEGRGEGVDRSHSRK